MATKKCLARGKVFSLWIKTNKGMTKALINEINTFIIVYDDEIYKKDEIKKIAQKGRVFDPKTTRHILPFKVKKINFNIENF